MNTLVKRRLFKLVVFLLLGAVVNVAVAWGIALLVDFGVVQDTLGGAKSRRGDWVVFQHVAGGAIRIRALVVSGDNIEEYEQYAMPPWLLPLWGPLAVQVRQQVIDEPFVRVADAYGWPTYSLWCAFAWNTAQWPNVLTDPRLSAILITSPMGGNYALSQRALPLRPIWRGFAINTIFYAAIVWMLTLGPFAARRFIRNKRGLCIKCGYDLRGAEHEVCPECGLAIVYP